MIIPITNIESLQYNLKTHKISEFIEDQIFSALTIIRIELEKHEIQSPNSKKEKYPNLSLILDWQQHSAIERNFNVFKTTDDFITFTSIFDDITHIGPKICDGTLNSFMDELNSFTLNVFRFTICKNEIDEFKLINSIINRIYKRKLIFTNEKIKKIAKEKGDIIKSIMGKYNPPPNNMDFTIEEIWLENASGKGGEPLVINWNIKLKSFQINTPIGYKGKTIPNRIIL